MLVNLWLPAGDSKVWLLIRVPRLWILRTSSEIVPRQRLETTSVPEFRFCFNMPPVPEFKVEQGAVPATDYMDHVGCTITTLNLISKICIIPYYMNAESFQSFSLKSKDPRRYQHSELERYG